MRTCSGRLLALGAALAAFAAACATAPTFDSQSRAALARRIIAEWSETSRLTAEQALDRYGPPEALAPGALGWRGRGDWKRIVVYAEPETGGAPGLKETVADRVPEARRADLAAFGRGVEVSADGAELSARSEEERLNYLALNLADEIARGARSPGEARAFYDKTLALAAAGKSSPYLSRLLFAPER